MAEHAQEMADDQGVRHVAVDVRVRVYPGAEPETRGVVVEDFGDTAGYGVDIGDNHIADPARRWAVLLDTGSLVFVDSDDLLPELPPAQASWPEAWPSHHRTGDRAGRGSGRPGLLGEIAAGRRAHLAANADALAQAGELLTQPPSIEHVDVIAWQTAEQMSLAMHGQMNPLPTDSRSPRASRRRENGSGERRRLVCVGIASRDPLL
jgi:hypothetical protein